MGVRVGGKGGGEGGRHGGDSDCTVARGTEAHSSRGGRRPWQKQGAGRGGEEGVVARESLWARMLARARCRFPARAELRGA